MFGTHLRLIRFAARISAAAILFALGGVHAQELEPRTYSPSPTGTNFALIGVVYQTGSVLTDPTSPVTNVDADATSSIVGYLRTFGLFGQSASFGIAVPYVWLDASGDVGESRRAVSRTGFGDPRLRFYLGLINSPALTPQEFAHRADAFALGTSLTVVPPLGEYDSSKLVNIGSNRWSFKPEIGATYPIGNLFTELIGGVWLFTDNDDYFGGNKREQDPLWSLQAHAGYTFRPGMWLAVDYTWYTGGESSLNGRDQGDMQSNTRYGLTFAYPLTRDISLKAAWSNGLATRVGGDFDTYSLYLQYRWFD